MYQDIMLEALRELRNGRPIKEAKFDPEKVDVSKVTAPTIPSFGMFLALENLVATGATYESLDKMSMEELKSKYNEGAEKLFKEYQEEIRKCMPPKDADIDEFDIEPLAQALTRSKHPRVPIKSASEWIDEAQEVLSAEYTPREDLDILNPVKRFIHDCLQRDADIKAIQQRAKKDYERRGFLGKLFWRGYSDNKKHFNGSRNKDSLFVRNRRESIGETLDEEAEYAIYMFDGESGPSEDDSDPVATFVASSSDEAEKKFQDFVAENSRPRSHVVYRYRKLHESVSEDVDPSHFIAIEEATKNSNYPELLDLSEALSLYRYIESQGYGWLLLQPGNGGNSWSILDDRAFPDDIAKKVVKQNRELDNRRYALSQLRVPEDPEGNSYGALDINANGTRAMLKLRDELQEEKLAQLIGDFYREQGSLPLSEQEIQEQVDKMLQSRKFSHTRYGGAVTLTFSVSKPIFGKFKIRDEIETTPWQMIDPIVDMRARIKDLK